MWVATRINSRSRGVFKVLNRIQFVAVEHPPIHLMEFTLLLAIKAECKSFPYPNIVWPQRLMETRQLREITHPPTKERRRNNSRRTEWITGSVPGSRGLAAAGGKEIVPLSHGPEKFYRNLMAPRITAVE